MQTDTVTILLATSTAVLFILFSLSLFYLWKFIKIIMVFEDDLSETLEELNKTEDTIKNVLEMPLFFDSPEVKVETNKILEQIKYCRFSIQKLIDRFTERSKRKYITIIEEPLERENEEEEIFIPKLPGQPPGTPNPLEMIYNHNIYNREGTVFNVGRTKRK